MVMNKDDIPILIGTLKRKTGIIGFEPAEVGHPVFQLRDRYIIFLKSETMITETFNNEKQKFFPSVCVPYYMDTLRPDIEFTKGEPSNSILKDIHDLSDKQSALNAGLIYD